MQKHKCGPGCRTANMLRTMALRRAQQVRFPDAIAVKSWCRVCSLPVMLEVIADYDMAVRHFYALDDTPMVHKNGHMENGGWGVHWRLDEVLAMIFPVEHQEECWPMSHWWKGHYGTALSEDQPIEVLTSESLAGYRDMHMNDELRMLDKQINTEPKTREELMQLGEDVWDTGELKEEYEILGFKKPFAMAVSKSTGTRGTFLFQDNPRFYFGWSADRVI